MNAGDTFFWSDRGKEPHLWIVVTDSSMYQDEVVCVAVTTWERWRDQACRLYQGDHPKIVHDSCVWYEEAIHPPLSKLMDWKANSIITMNVPVQPDVLARVRQGAEASDDLTNEVRDILKDQGIVFW